MLPLDDRGLTLGDGLFETLLWDGAALEFWPEHFQRLSRGCAVLGLPAPGEAEALDQALAAAKTLGEDRGAVRLTLTAGSGGRGLDRPDRPTLRLLATAAPAPFIQTPITLATSTIRRNDASPTSRLKTLNYLDNILARREAQAQGADEALLLNTRGEVACAAVANIVWRKDGLLFTPALDCGALDGVIRGRLIKSRTVREVRTGLETVFGADAVYLTNSLVGVRPVSRLDGRDLPLGPKLEAG